MPYFDGARGRLHYRHWPAGHPAATVALLPGIGQHSGHYHRFARALNTAGITLWTLDTAGHGLSEGTADRPGTLPELAADAKTFLSVIPTEPTPLVLMGHSLGAATALALMGSTELAGLILCGTPKTILLGEAPKSARGDGAAAQSRGALSDRHAPVLPTGLATLLVHGVDDRRAPVAIAREWANRQPAAEFREYPDAGHDLLHEPVHAEVTADIAAWVGAIAGKS